MPEIQVFQCPSCGAHISYEGDGEATTTCQYCGTVVIVPEEIRTAAKTASAAEVPPAEPEWEPPVVPTTEPVTPEKLAELKNLAQNGQKIEAIKLYRQLFGAGLRDAKDAVEKLEAGQPLVITTSSTFSSTTLPPADKDARLAAVFKVLQTGNKIEAIKLYRQFFDTGLDVAKQAVEAMQPGVESSPPQGSYPSTPAAYPMPAPRPRKSRTGCISAGGILFVIGMIVFVGAMVLGVPFRLSGSYKQAVLAASTDPAVIEALGAPVQASWLPITGNLDCGGSYCSADYNIPIHGSRKSGRIQVMSDSKGAKLFNEGTWTLDATVIVGGESIDLRPARQASAGRVQATAAPFPSPIPSPTPAPTENQTATAEAEAAAQVEQTATEGAQTQATAQAILSTESAWQPLFVDKFKDNQNGWFTGTKQDAYISVVSALSSGVYRWKITAKQSNSYMNLIPTSSIPLTDFYAAVDIQSMQGGEGGDYAYGLVVRHVDSDYVFFGLQNDGSYRLLVVYGSGIYTDIVQHSDAILTGAGKPNRLSVAAVESDFVFSINDQPVYNLNEDIAAGDIGLGVDVSHKGSPATVEFTNFEIRNP